MPALVQELENADSAEFGSGEIVSPGRYLDIESGALVEIRESDSLPEGVRVVRYSRRFRRLEESKDKACAA